VRLYESRGGATRGRLELGFDVERVWRVDLLERQLDVEPGLDPLDLTLRAFELVTLRVTPARRQRR